MEVDIRKLQQNCTVATTPTLGDYLTVETAETIETQQPRPQTRRYSNYCNYCDY